MFRNSLKNTFGIEFRRLKSQFKYKTEGSSFNINKDRSGRRRTERTQENINLFQEKLIYYPRISAKNGLEISKSTINWITKRDLKLNFYKMHVRKERKNLKWS